MADVFKDIQTTSADNMSISQLPILFSPLDSNDNNGDPISFFYCQKFNLGH